MTIASDTAALDPIAATRPFASSRDGIAWWQVASTLAALGLTLAALRGLAPWPAKLLLVLPLSGLIIRTFVLQHDCSHSSLFSTRALNDRVGSLLALIPGVAYMAWRAEHNWHHAHWGKLDSRGVDFYNSPLTRQEVLDAPDLARARAKAVTPWVVFALGSAALLIQRKQPSAFWPFKPNFPSPVPDRAQLIRGVWINNAGYALWNLALIAGLGIWTWLLLYLPALFIAGGIGSWLFWVQHAFDGTYFARDGEWRYADAALEGASYLKLPWPLSWFTADIGLHHVHHLNPRIPNYRLEEARRAIPELAAIAPLTGKQLVDSFRMLCWDEGRQRIMTIDEALADAA